MADPPGTDKPGSRRTIEWEWGPPGYACVYLDKEGRIVGRDRVIG